MLKLLQISSVPERNFHDIQAEQLFTEHEAEIMQIVRNGISEYLNDENLCNDDEDMFPRRCFLTGEWYIKEIGSFDGEPELFFTVRTAFLGTDTGVPDEYLGLEVILYYKDGFFPDGINSEAL